MSRTPTTPFIPPLLTPRGSPQPETSPVIPGYTPAGPPSNFPFFAAHSPYTTSPFIPNLGSSPAGLGGHSPNSAPNIRPDGLSTDYTGYPDPYPTPPLAHTPVVPPPMHAYPPHPGYTSAPGGYATFMQAGQTPWAPPQMLHSPYPPQGARIPPPAMYNTPYAPYSTPLPGAGWGLPPPHQVPPPPPPGHHPQHQPQYFPPHADPNAWYGQHGPNAHQGYRAPAEPPSQVYDRMNPFTAGNHYGPVLDPFLIKVVKAPTRLNPLISPPSEETADSPYIKWDMLFSTATAQRSDEPAHLSWSKGRDEPATFPRVSSLRIVSMFFPWVIMVKARDLDRGVTCDEVIESIGSEMQRLSSKTDYEVLSQRGKQEVVNAYKFNRSPSEGVPGGRLGHAMKKLDFLRRNTVFAGVEANERVVKAVCGEVLPCTFVLRCAERDYQSAKEAQEHDARMRQAAAQQARSASRNAGARSRANSTNTRITVQAPSVSSQSTYDDDDSDSDHPGLDR